MNDSIDAICGGLGVLRSISLIRFADGALRCEANVGALCHHWLNFQFSPIVGETPVFLAIRRLARRRSVAGLTGLAPRSPACYRQLRHLADEKAMAPTLGEVASAKPWVSI